MIEALVTIRLSQAEMAEFRTWVSERKARFDRLQEIIDSANNEDSSTLTAKNAGETNSDVVESENGTYSKILEVVKGKGWMASKEILDRLKSEHEVQIKRATLRYHLSKGLGKHFEHRGKGGASKWRASTKK